MAKQQATVENSISSEGWDHIINELLKQDCKNIVLFLRNPIREYLLKHPQSQIRCRLEINRRLASGDSEVISNFTMKGTCSAAKTKQAICAVILEGELQKVWKRGPSCSCPQLTINHEELANLDSAAGKERGHESGAETLVELSHIGPATATFLKKNGVQTSADLSSERIQQFLECEETPGGIKGALTRYLNEQS